MSASGKLQCSGDRSDNVRLGPFTVIAFLKCNSIAKLNFDAASFVNQVRNNLVDCNQLAGPKQFLVFIFSAMSDDGVFTGFKSLDGLLVLF